MKRRTRTLFFFMLPLLFLSCATIGSGFYGDAGLTVTDQLNKGMHETLSQDSLYPFVFEGEILASDTQVKMLWQGLTGAGYTVETPVITMNRPLRKEDSSLFASSWEIQSFFEKYSEGNDRILLVEGQDTAFYLLMRKMEHQEYKLLGWKEASQ